MGRGWLFGLGGGDGDAFDGDELDDVAPPFWETDVVQLTERDRREVNLYEGLQPLWPKLGQLMVRRDGRRRRRRRRYASTRASIGARTRGD